MNNQNNQGAPANQAANLVYLAHDRDRSIRFYASPNLYEFNHGIVYPKYGENASFVIKPVMLQENGENFP